MQENTTIPFIPMEEVPKQSETSVPSKPTVQKSMPDKQVPSQTTQVIKKKTTTQEIIELKLSPRLLVTIYGIAKLKHTSVERYILNAIKKENERQLKESS